MSDLDPRALRDAFGRFMTGVAVVTTLGADGRPVGFTANSFSSVSLDPPLLLVCPGTFLSSYRTFAACDRFGVSILAETQQAAANTFAGFKGDRFAQVDHQPDAHGIPLISGAIAQFSCRTSSVVPAGDHAILIGEVTGFDQTGAGGLGYAGGQFFSLGMERSARDPAARLNVAGAVLRDRDHVLLEKTEEGYRLPECTVPERSALRQSLTADLLKRGVDARLGAVYSVFEDPDRGAHCAYLLAETRAVSPRCALTAVPLHDLPDLPCRSPAAASMLARFSRESRIRNFNFYMGDAASGEIHTLAGGA